MLAQLTSPNQDVASRRGGAKTNACGEQDGTKDCYVLEGSLPEILEGWKWVKQAELATEPTEVAEAMVKQYLGTLSNFDHSVSAPCDGSPRVAWRPLEILVVFTTASKREGTCPMKVKQSLAWYV